MKILHLLIVAFIGISIFGSGIAYAQYSKEAINLATNSSQFQSLVKGYNYTFEEFFHPASINSSIGLVFDLNNSTFSNDHLVTYPLYVYENENSTKVLKVTTTPSLKDQLMMARTSLPPRGTSTIPSEESEKTMMTITIGVAFSGTAATVFFILRKTKISK